MEICHLLHFHIPGVLLPCWTLPNSWIPIAGTQLKLTDDPLWEKGWVLCSQGTFQAGPWKTHIHYCSLAVKSVKGSVPPNTHASDTGPLLGSPELRTQDLPTAWECRDLTWRLAGIQVRRDLSQIMEMIRKGHPSKVLIPPSQYAA